MCSTPKERGIKLSENLWKNMFHLVQVSFSSIIYTDLRDKLKSVSEFYLVLYKAFSMQLISNILTFHCAFFLAGSHASNVFAFCPWVMIKKWEDSNIFLLYNHKLFKFVIKNNSAYSACLREYKKRKIWEYLSTSAESWALTAIWASMCGWIVSRADNLLFRSSQMISFKNNSIFHCKTVNRLKKSMSLNKTANFLSPTTTLFPSLIALSSAWHIFNFFKYGKKLKYLIL